MKTRKRVLESAKFNHNYVNPIKAGGSESMYLEKDLRE